MTNLTLISFAVKNKYEVMEQVRDSNWNILREALVITSNFEERKTKKKKLEKWNSRPNEREII